MAQNQSTRGPSVRSIVLGSLVALAVVTVIVLLLVTGGGKPKLGVGQQMGPSGASGGTHHAKDATSSNTTIQFGGSGSDLWAVTGTGALELTSNGGTSWMTSSPPVALKGLIPNRYSVAMAGTTVWLVAPNGSGEYLFRSSDGGGSWAPGVAIPTTAGQTTGTHSAQPDVVYADLVNPDIGYITVNDFLQATEAVSTLDRTADGGGTFVATSLPTFGSVLFRNPDQGFLVGGPGMQHVYATRDQGRTWVPVPVEPPATGNFTVGNPLFAAGSSVSLPITVTATGHSSVYMMRIPGGLSGTTPAATPVISGSPSSPLEVSGPSSRVFVAQRGSTMFAEDPNGDTAYRSIDTGTSWTKTVSHGLPSGWTVGGLVATGPTSAVVKMDNNECQNKTACTYNSSLFTTGDGGANWSPVAFTGSAT